MRRDIVQKKIRQRGKEFAAGGAIVTLTCVVMACIMVSGDEPEMGAAFG